MSPTPSANACLRCGSALEEGFLLEEGHMANGKVLRWMPGAPRHGFFGLRRNGIALEVAARRCSRCGWLDLYAPRPSDAT